MLQPKNTFELLNACEAENLFPKLILQLNKDFQLANLNESFENSITPIQLKETLSAILLNLISNRYDDYLNLLYRIDVSEKELLKIDNNNLVEELAFVVLKREFQKVWFKNKF